MTALRRRRRPLFPDKEDSLAAVKDNLVPLTALIVLIGGGLEPMKLNIEHVRRLAGLISLCWRPSEMVFSAT